MPEGQGTAVVLDGTVTARGEMTAAAVTASSFQPLRHRQKETRAKAPEMAVNDEDSLFPEPKRLEVQGKPVTRRTLEPPERTAPRPPSSEPKVEPEEVECGGEKAERTELPGEKGIAEGKAAHGEEKQAGALAKAETDWDAVSSRYSQSLRHRSVGTGMGASFLHQQGREAHAQPPEHATHNPAHPSAHPHVTELLPAPSASFAATESEPKERTQLQPPAMKGADTPVKTSPIAVAVVAEGEAKASPTSEPKGHISSMGRDGGTGRSKVQPASPPLGHTRFAHTVLAATGDVSRRPPVSALDAAGSDEVALELLRGGRSAVAAIVKERLTHIKLVALHCREGDLAAALAHLDQMAGLGGGEELVVGVATDLLSRLSLESSATTLDVAERVLPWIDRLMASQPTLLGPEVQELARRRRTEVAVGAAEVHSTDVRLCPQRTHTHTHTLQVIVLAASL